MVCHIKQNSNVNSTNLGKKHIVNPNSFPGHVVHVPNTSHLIMVAETYINMVQQ